VTRRRKLALAVLVPAGVAAGLIAWFLFQYGDVARQAMEVAEDVDVDVSMQGLSMTQGEEGRVRWQLDAAGGSYERDREVIGLDKPRITYYPESDGPVLEVSAPEGEVNREREIAELWPEVSVKYGESSITSERLYYSGGNGTVRLTGDVRMVRPDSEIRAPEAVFHLRENRLRAKGGVEAEFMVSAPGKEEKQ
jgi:LPS export ABC transporter protein LptC